MVYTKLEQFRVVEMRRGAVYKTEKAGERWFPIAEQPERYKAIDGLMWVETGKYHSGPKPPAE